MGKRDSVWTSLKEKIIVNRANFVIWTVFYFIAAAIIEWGLIFTWRPGIMNLGHPLLRMVMFYIIFVGIYLFVIFFKVVSRKGKEIEE